MGFVRFDNEGRLLDRFGKPVHMVGINYVASYICTNFWEDWRPEVIEQDLKTIAQMGLHAVRIPMHWGFMEPEQGQYNAVFEQEFADFIKLCKKYELYVMPWFLVGIATRMYDVPFRNGRSFFEEEMSKAAEAHLKHFIEPYKEEECILFWDICDEPEWYSWVAGADQLPYDRVKVVNWIKRMYQAIKSVDPNHQVTLGFGHIATANYGMDVRDMADILDLMVVTAYPQAVDEGIDTVRNNYTVPYHVKMNSRGTPVFTCEAPGMSDIWNSEDMIGRYFKVSLYSNLVNGSTGVLPWVYTDFEEAVWHETPLEENLSEPGFGIVTSDGRWKASANALSEFAAFVKKYDIGKYCPEKAEAAVLVPEGYYKNIGRAFPMIYSAYTLAKGCGINVDLVWSTEELSAYKLLMMPTTAGMTTSMWDKVRQFAENGGIVYHAYDRWSLNAYFNKLFGVEILTNDTDYGYEQMRAVQDFGAWKQGDEIPFTGTGRGCVLRVRPKSAEVLCTFEDGEPALLRHSYGKGVCYLATLPLDIGLMKIPYREYLGTSSFALIDMLIQEAGISRLLHVLHPAVETGCMRDPETDEMLIFCINHDNIAVDAKMEVDTALIPKAWELRKLSTNQRVDLTDTMISLEPAGVDIYVLVPKNVRL